MLAVPLPATEVEKMLDPSLALAASNSAELCSVSGPTEAVERLRQELQAQGVESRPLHTSHAFHSPMVDLIVAPLAAELNERRFWSSSKRDRSVTS